MAKFRGSLSFCSNFYNCPVVYEGKLYNSSEHAFMSAKTDDPTIKEQIRACKTPAEAKALGRSIPLPKDWDTNRVKVMLDVLIAKFSQNQDLLTKLKQVKDEDLIEINEWHDYFWGVCNDKGVNMLGRLLQVVKYTL